MPNDPANNDLWILMARCLSGEATAEEQLLLQTLLEQKSSMQQQYDMLKEMWLAGKMDNAGIDSEATKNLGYLLRNVPTEGESTEKINFIVRLFYERRKVFATGGMIAAVIIGAIVFWPATRQNDLIKPTTATRMQTLVAENGSKTRTILPDGSVVWLNAGSRITYSNDFSGVTREVTLEGEAYFDVKKEPQRPFIVHVAGIDISVLGTIFNVKSYASDKTVETTLLRGLVKITKHGSEKQKPVYLYPNEKLIVQKVAANEDSILPDNNAIANGNKAREFTITRLDTLKHEKSLTEVAWVFNRLEFQNESFEQLAARLERWYNISIVFDDDFVKQLSFTGSFENETVEQALAALSIATPFEYNLVGTEIHIGRKLK